MNELTKPQKVLLRILSLLVAISLVVDAGNLRQLLGEDEINEAAGDTNAPTFAPSDTGEAFNDLDAH